MINLSNVIDKTFKTKLWKHVSVVINQNPEASWDSPQCPYWDGGSEQLPLHPHPLYVPPLGFKILITPSVQYMFSLLWGRRKKLFHAD